jgi:PAB1-binding protein PBP1
MLEERGILINDSGMDEEDLYGAVVRDNNKYIPPALRKQQQEQQTNKQQPQVKKETKNASVTDKVIANNPPKSNESPIANLPPLRKNSDEKDKVIFENTQFIQKLNTFSFQINENKQTNRIESEVADTFKHFAIKEKDKLHAKKQALQKKEIEERVAKLKMFHQTFKLNVPVPADLVPLLSTGKKNTSSASPSTSPSDESSPKQESSPSATTPVASSKKNSPVAVPATAKSPSPVPEGNTNQNATKASNSGTSFKLNAKASSFKPNPSAAAFVPSSSLTSVTYHDEKNSFFGGKHLKKELANDCITMKDAFKPPLLKKHDRPSSVGPTWPFGNMPYRVQFNQFYDENAFNGYASSGYGYGYPQYPYPHVS